MTQIKIDLASLIFLGAWRQFRLRPSARFRTTPALCLSLPMPRPSEQCAAIAELRSSLQSVRRVDRPKCWKRSSSLASTNDVPSADLYKSAQPLKKSLLMLATASSVPASSLAEKCLARSGCEWRPRRLVGMLV